MKPLRCHLLLLPSLLASPALACELCSAPQPKPLRGLVHGTGPQGSLDYLIAAVAVVIVLLALVWAVKCLVRPGERDPAHIKRTILHPNSYGS